ncbi:MAG: primosomal protein N', partial [Agromyces sp.]
MTETVARVLVESPLPQLDHLFDYRIPDALRGEVAVGQRVSMPLRSTGRIAQGWVVELGDTSAFSGTLADLKAVLTPHPVLPPMLYELARRLADRAAGVASDVLRLAIPARHVRAEKSFATTEEPALAAVTPMPITGYPDDASELLLAPGSRYALTTIPRLLTTQSHAIPHWAATFTELAAGVLSRSESAILAVPDYRDQEALERALRAVFPAERIVTVDARQSAADRFRNHLRLVRGG